MRLPDRVDINRVRTRLFRRTCLVLSPERSPVDQDAVETALKAPAPSALRQRVLTDFTWRRAGEATLASYEHALLRIARTSEKRLQRWIFPGRKSSLPSRKRSSSSLQQRLNQGIIERDREGPFSRELWQECAEFGIQGLPFPEKYGGSNADILTTMLTMEGLGYGCRDNGLIFGINAQMWSVQMPILTLRDRGAEGEVPARPLPRRARLAPTACPSRTRDRTPSACARAPSAATAATCSTARRPSSPTRRCATWRWCSPRSIRPSACSA